MARLCVVTSSIGGANSISSVPLPCNVRANFDLEGEQVSRSREGQLAVSSGPSGRQSVTSAAEGEAAETVGKRT
jgi:hypothetical protein